MDGWMSVVKLFQIATPAVFVRFLRKLAHVICVPMRKNCGSDFQNFAVKFWAADRRSLVFYLLPLPTSCI